MPAADVAEIAKVQAPEKLASPVEMLIPTPLGADQGGVDLNPDQARDMEKAAATAAVVPASEPVQTRRPVSGFKPRHEGLHRIYNTGVAGGIFLLALPIIAVLTLLVFVTQGRPIFYQGARVGRNGSSFNIIKFRTLDTAKAAKLTQNQVLPQGSGLETPMGGFLRDTRLDELPQLWNIIRGDMNICGPRPVREEIAALHRQDIPDYDARFAVKPGMLGPTQALMGHGTPKPVRARLNAALCRKPVNYWREIEMMVLVPACVFARTATLLASRAGKLARRVGTRFTGGTSRGTRHAATHATLDVLGKPVDRNMAAKYGVAVQFVDAMGQAHDVRWIDDKSFVTAGSLAMNPALDAAQGPTLDAAQGPTLDGALEITLPNGTLRRARVSGSFAGQAKLGTAAGADELVELAYEPASKYAHHVLERYVYQRVVVPHYSHFLLGRLLPSSGFMSNWHNLFGSISGFGQLQGGTAASGPASGVRTER
ncbi:sugar transferase [Tritonibacter multivorans]|nr:sugar transferase [Tritonibacter multivorans]MDA7422249.1 sugar transferase [Tritonibacter multivorans]